MWFVQLIYCGSLIEHCNKSTASIAQTPNTNWQMDNNNGAHQHHLESRTPTISKIISSNIVHERANVMLKTNNTTQ